MRTMTARPVRAIDRYDNGTVRYRGANVAGKMHGPWKFFRRDGSLMRSGSFEHGKQVGVWRTFDKDGTVVKETTFSSQTALARAENPSRGATRPVRAPRARSEGR